MALIVNEAFEQQQELDVPEWFNTCGDVNTTVGEYEEMALQLLHIHLQPETD